MLQRLGFYTLKYWLCKGKKEVNMKNWIDWVTMILVVVGGINWGLVGAANWNLVEALLGAWPMVVKIVYILVGLSALWVGYMAATMDKK